jgi:hypothetical protein
VNQSRIKIANSDGAKKIKQYKTKFILLFTHQCRSLRWDPAMVIGEISFDCLFDRNKKTFFLILADMLVPTA